MSFSFQFTAKGPRAIELAEEQHAHGYTPPEVVAFVKAAIVNAGEKGAVALWRVTASGHQNTSDTAYPGMASATITVEPLTVTE